MRQAGSRLPRSIALFALLILVLLWGCARGEESGAPSSTRTDSTTEKASSGATGETTASESTGIEKPETTREDSVSAGSSSGETTDVGDEVAKMSLREAVGQMFVVGMSGTRPDYYIEKMVRERNIGGVLLFGYNMKSAGQTRRMVDSLQRLSLETEPSIPLLIATDQEGGEISHAPWVTPQPPASRIGESGDPRQARDIAARMGRELRSAGVNTDLAPVVDTGFGSAIGNRSFSENPRVVAKMGAASVEGFESVGVVSAAKHFPNHGVATTDSHTALPVVDHDLATMRSYDLPPFEAAVDAGVPVVMMGHLLYPALDPDLPASLSPAATSLLRQDLGFEGVIATDDLAMTGASSGGSPSRATVEAVDAGVDLLIMSSPPPQQAEAYDAVVAAVRSGEIPRERINQAVERIMKVKNTYPLYERH